VERLFNDREAELQPRVDRRRVRVATLAPGDLPGSLAAFDAFARDVDARTAGATDGRLAGAARSARSAVEHARHWLAATRDDAPALEAGARRLALTLGRTMELALLVEHAAWCAERGTAEAARAAVTRFARHGVDAIDDAPVDESAALLGDSTS
jgi:hypothetical protein